MKESLKTFSIKQLQKYNLPVTDQNLKKLRRKFTSVLKTDKPFKQRNTWENAKSQIIGRNKVKFFDSKDLAILEQKVQHYMEKQIIKNASMPAKQMKKEIKKNRLTLAQIDEEMQQQQDKLTKELSNPKSPIWNIFSPESTNQQQLNSSIYDQTEETLRDEINQIMLEALFNKFFIPAPNWKKRFVHDYNLVNNPAADQNIDSPLYIDANYRLTHPKGENSYYKDRN